MEDLPTAQKRSRSISRERRDSPPPKRARDSPAGAREPHRRRDNEEADDRSPQRHPDRDFERQGRARSRSPRRSEASDRGGRRDRDRLRSPRREYDDQRGGRSDRRDGERSFHGQGQRDWDRDGGRRRDGDGYNRGRDFRAQQPSDSGRDRMDERDDVGEDGEEYVGSSRGRERAERSTRDDREREGGPPRDADGGDRPRKKKPNFGGFSYKDKRRNDNDHDRRDQGRPSTSFRGYKNRSPSPRRPSANTKDTSKPPRRPPPAASSSRPVAATEELILVYLNDRTGTRTAVPCGPDDTVGQLKAVAAGLIGRRVDAIELSRQGMGRLNDKITLADYEIHNGVQLDLYTRSG